MATFSDCILRSGEKIRGMGDTYTQAIAVRIQERLFIRMCQVSRSLSKMEVLTLKKRNSPVRKISMKIITFN